MLQSTDNACIHKDRVRLPSPSKALCSELSSQNLVAMGAYLNLHQSARQISTRPFFSKPLLLRCPQPAADLGMLLLTHSHCKTHHCELLAGVHRCQVGNQTCKLLDILPCSHLLNVSPFPQTQHTQTYKRPSSSKLAPTSDISHGWEWLCLLAAVQAVLQGSL